jgi:hypothetical protein
MAEPPYSTGQGVNAPTFRPFLPHLFLTRTRRASGHPHAPSPARTLPLRSQPSRATPSRCRVPTPGQGPFFSLPWRVLDPVGPGLGAVRVTAVEPHRQRAAAEPPSLWDKPSSTSGSLPNPVGFCHTRFSEENQVLAICMPGSSFIHIVTS